MDPHLRPRFRGAEADFAAVPPSDSADDGEPKAGAASISFCGEEALEELPLEGLINARAVVRYREAGALFVQREFQKNGSALSYAQRIVDKILDQRVQVGAG